MNKFSYPNPNTKRITHKNTDFYIMNYDGMSKIDIYCPENMNIPLLPTRYNKKLIFPTGNITGWYCHNEIRRAVDLGYTIKKVYKTYYYLENCDPFKSFVTDLYNKRLYYKSINSPMGYVCKILMNALSGKFGQKFLNKDNYVSEELLNIEDFKCNTTPERVGDFFRIVEDREPSCFCIPIWSAYVTAYGRIELHNYLKISDPVYCDTDSLITKKQFKDSKELGELKLEYRIKKGILIKPKMYYIEYENKYLSKVKGLGKRLCGIEFMNLISTKESEYKKFVKFKEALKRKLIPNQVISIIKHFNLEDNKRNWFKKKFNVKELQYSKPLNMDDLIRIDEEIIYKKAIISYVHPITEIN